MEIDISAESQQVLDQVVMSGLFETRREALDNAVRLLGENTATCSASDGSISSEQWIAKFHEWTRRRRRGNSSMDDSRESIY